MSDDIHACFVSYRHPESSGSREEKIIRHVVRAITDHVEVYTHDHKVFVDKARLVAGYEYDKTLAEAICRSACMVIVYWPSYLESDYCLSEIATMLRIERRRRKLLGPQLQKCRLLIPIVLHGDYEELPNDVRKGCHYLDYRAQATRPNFNIGNDLRMSAALYDVAKYIKSLCEKMKQSRELLFGGCDKATLESGTPWAMPKQPFPGR